MQKKLIERKKNTYTIVYGSKINVHVSSALSLSFQTEDTVHPKSRDLLYRERERRKDLL